MKSRDRKQFVNYFRLGEIKFTLKPARLARKEPRKVFSGQDDTLTEKGKLIYFSRAL